MYEEKEIKFKKVKRQKKKKKESKKKESKKKEKKTILITKEKEKRNRPQINIPNTIDIKKIMLRLFTLVIVMMGIIFIISRIGKHNDQKNSTFTNNINEIINTTLTNYKQGQLPINIGDSTSFLLEELAEKNKMNDIKDKDGKSCDYINSYIILTKTKEKEYRLKVFLKCSDQEKTTEKILTCEDTCTIKK